MQDRCHLLRPNGRLPRVVLTCKSSKKSQRTHDVLILNPRDQPHGSVIDPLLNIVTALLTLTCHGVKCGKPSDVLAHALAAWPQETYRIKVRRCHVTTRCVRQRRVVRAHPGVFEVLRDGFGCGCKRRKAIRIPKEVRVPVLLRIGGIGSVVVAARGSRDPFTLAPLWK